MEFLEVVASVASIATATVAVYGYGSYRLSVHRRMRALEKLLATKTQPGDNSLTVAQLAAAIVATEAQVIEAASQSKRIFGTGGPIGREFRLTLVKPQ